MKYPYMAYSDKVTPLPVFKGLTGDPFVVDLSVGSQVFDTVDIHDQHAFQAWLETRMKGRYTWGLASYLEDRQTILSKYPQMKEEERWFHLGLDIIVDLDTPLYAPLDSVVQESGYEEGEGNYGGNVLLRHDSPDFDTFYSLYGHLKRTSLPEPGTVFKAGQEFARIGDFHENGNWFYHTHLQVITQKGYDTGWVSRGYCNAGDLSVMDGLCPSPLSLFRR
ncbi:MAG: peptidoglycan DD-metalloendopeptidase family protein [Desulfobacterales bacterium]|nr:peptidoglycan DD-metalloendopeptidase family protein [Desulfobacterales bacterium]